MRFPNTWSKTWKSKDFKRNRRVLLDYGPNGPAAHWEILLSDLLHLQQLKMRAGGMSESSKWKKQKRSPRPPRHLVRSPSSQMDQAQSGTLSNNNLSGYSNTVTLPQKEVCGVPMSNCVTAFLSYQMGSHSLSKACPHPTYQLQTALLRPFLALQPQTVAWTPVPKPPLGMTSQTLNSIAHLQTSLALLLLFLGVSPALQMHRYGCWKSWTISLCAQNKFLYTKVVFNVYFPDCHVIFVNYCPCWRVLPVFSVFICLQSEGRPADPAQSASVESIPEVLEDKGSTTEQSDSASVHDMDYVNPRGVRFTQSTQRDGKCSSAVYTGVKRSSVCPG